MPLETILHDLQYACRLLSRNAGSTVVTILALALGIGVNTTVFTAYKAMVARPIEGREPTRMVNLALRRDSGSDFKFSYPDYQAYRDSVRSFQGVIAFRISTVKLSGAGEMVSQRTATAESAIGKLGLMPPGAINAEFASVSLVSENYFQVLGIAPLAGRTFESMGAAELLANPSVLISENYWQRRFSGDPAILGRTVQLNNTAVTIVGIAPHNFVGTGIGAPAFWVPIGLEPLLQADTQWLRNRENFSYRLFGRLTAGATPAQAQAEVNSLADQLRTLHPRESEAAKAATALVWPGSPFPLPLQSYGGLQMTILLIMAAAGLVLAVACANVGSLQLARARSRQNELHTRLSLGATRLRVVRQLLTESSLVGLLSGLAALLFCWVFSTAAAALYAIALPVEFGTMVFNVTPDLEIFAYVSAVSLFAGLLAGLAPALDSSRAASSIRAATSSARSRRLQNALVTVQVALCLVLLSAGVILIRTALQALNAEPGYDSQNLVMASLRFPESSKYTPARQLALLREIRSRLAAVPGVVSVTSARSPEESRYRTPARALDTQQKPLILRYTYVEPNYFATLGIPLPLGRSFTQHEPVVIVSESAAKKLWPAGNPIERSLRLGLTDERIRPSSEMQTTGATYQVVGIARDKRGVQFDGRDVEEIYLPLREDQLVSRPLLLRTHSSPAQSQRSVDTVLASVDRDIVVTSFNLEAMRRLSASFITSSLLAVVASTIGLFGLLLAIMGISGTVSYIVVLRTREVGIRMAIGAQPRDVLTLILGETARPVLAGLGIGILLTSAASALASGLLFGLNGIDGPAIALVSLLFLLIALLAAYPPARRALRVDPTVALRYE